EQIVENKHPQTVRITLADKRRFELTFPEMKGDSITGYLGDVERDRGYVESHPYQFHRTAYALADVRAFETRHFSAGKTTLCVLAIGATAGLIALAIVASSDMPGSSGGGSSGGGGSGDPYAMSCPHLSSWDGTRWWLDSGTYGGAILKPLARTDVDELEHAR